MIKLEERANKESNSDKKLFRLVSTPNQLREKLIIAEHGMDDRIVEIMKKIYLANLHMFFPKDNLKIEEINEVLFDINKEGNRGVVLFTEKYEPIFLPVNDKMYEKVREDFIEAVQEFDKNGFEQVDSKWADQYIAIEEQRVSSPTINFIDDKFKALEILQIRQKNQCLLFYSK